MDLNESLWFEIEAAFARIEHRCVVARAQELVVAQRRAEEQLAQALSSRSMPPAGAISSPVATGRWARAAELAREARFRDEHRDGADFVALRQDVRTTLSDLRSLLLERLAEHDVYYTLFALVVYSDELVGRATRGASERWEPLQSEFYEIENGGELFYQVLDERVRDSDTHPLVLETFYFCLLDGFSGMHQPGSRRLAEYMTTLRARFPLTEPKFPHVEIPAFRPELAAFPMFYYAIGGAVLVSSYVLLNLLAPG
jgi:type IV/VI secretion system ImpK/VasF family protein